jgi:hypothetical protein
MCNGKMRKLISQSTFHLKGTGWYVTDYASKGRKDTSAPAPKTESKGADKGEKKQKKATSPAKEKSSKTS